MKFRLIASALVILVIFACMFFLDDKQTPNITPAIPSSSPDDGAMKGFKIN